MAIGERPQTSIFDADNLIEDEALVGQLEAWADAKAALVPYREAFQTADELVKSEIKQRGLEPGEYRVGRFVVVVGERAAQPVEFERKAGSFVRLRLAKADDA